MSLVAGTRLDHYEIVRALGAGPDLTTDPARVKRFEQEARAASALNHPNVCTIHTLEQSPDGRHLIAMEFVEGGRS